MLKWALDTYKVKKSNRPWTILATLDFQENLSKKIRWPDFENCFCWVGSSETNWKKIAQKCISMKTRDETIRKNPTTRTWGFSVFDNKGLTVSLWILQHSWWLCRTTERRVNFLEVNGREKLNYWSIFCCFCCRCQYHITATN